ncbi:uncharacterized protein RBU57_008192 [Macrochelys suwanniensis]
MVFTPSSFPLLSAIAQLTMLATYSRCTPAWSRQEILDRLCGEEDVQAQFQTICRNVDIYHTLLRGCRRDQQQCRTKAKELWHTYQNARETNNRSSAKPQTCPFYKEMQARPGKDTPPDPSTVDTSEKPESQTPGVNNEEEEELVVEDEEEEYGTGHQRIQLPSKPGPVSDSAAVQAINHSCHYNLQALPLHTCRTPEPDKEDSR